MYTYIAKRTYWRTGVVLQIGGNRAYIKADLEDSKLFIRVTGSPSTQRDALSHIRHTFTTIHKTISALQVSEWIPLPEDPEELVEYDRLISLEQRGETQFQGKNRNYSIRDLLNGIEAKPLHVYDDRDPEFPRYSNPTPMPDPSPPSHPPNPNPWRGAGSFYLVAFTVVIGGLTAASLLAPWYALLFIAVVAILGIGVISALQLRNDQALAEKNFLKLMIKSYENLPLLTRLPQAQSQRDEQDPLDQ